MKTVRLLAVLALVILSLGFSSCSHSSSDDVVTPVTPAGMFIRYKYNGVFYQHVAETITSLKRDIRGNDGVDATYKSLSLWTPLNIAAGSYAITDQPSNVNSYGGVFDVGTDTTVNGTSGNMTITLVTSTTIEGTFHFSGLANGTGAVTEVTEGTFRADR